MLREIGKYDPIQPFLSPYSLSTDTSFANITYCTMIASPARKSLNYILGFATLFILAYSLDLSAQARMFPVHPFDDSIYYGPMDYVEHDGDLYMSLRSLEFGTELYKFDGQTLTRITDLNPGPGDSGVRPLASYGSDLFLVATDDGFVSGQGFYKTNGEVGNLQEVVSADPAVELRPQSECVQINGLLFCASATSSAVSGSYTLIKTNGTATEVVDPASGFPGPRRLRVLNGKIIFMNSSLNGVYSSDGTRTRAIGLFGSVLRDFAELDGWLYFGATKSVWRTDGTDLEQVANFPSMPNGALPEAMTSFNGWIWAVVEPGPGPERFLWKTNGTDSEIVVEGRWTRLPAELDGFLYFTGNVAEDGGLVASDHDLWRTDGTTFEEVADIFPGPSSSSIELMTTFGDKVYFRANDGVVGHELWSTDGTTTELVQDLRPGSLWGFPADLYPWEDKLVFSAADNRSQNHLWCLGCPEELPVELASFSAFANNDDIVLKWSTLSETDNAGFQIEHSNGDDIFEQVAWVDGAGTSIEKSDYTYIVSDFLPGRNRFRLKQVDLDGGHEYSSIVEISTDLPAGLNISSVYPNPFLDDFNLTVSVQKGGDYYISVLDLLGREVTEKKRVVLEPGEVQTISINGQTLPAGSYVYKIQGEDNYRTGLVVKVN